MPATAGFLTVSITFVAYHHSRVVGMRVLLALALLVGCENEGTECKDTARCLRDASVFNPLEGTATVDLIQSGFMFTEGPQWFGDKLVFSDIPANTIYKLENG